MQRLHHRAVAGVGDTVSTVRELSDDSPGSVVCRGADLVRAQASPGWRASDPPRPHMVGQLSRIQHARAVDGDIVYGAEWGGSEVRWRPLENRTAHHTVIPRRTEPRV